MSISRCPVRVLLPVLLLAPGCMKETALPPTTVNTGELRLAFDLRYGLQPLERHQRYPYGDGHGVHFTMAKVMLSDFRVADTHGRLLGEFKGAPMLLSIDGPEQVVLGTLPAVALGGLSFRAGLNDSLDRLPATPGAWPLDQEDMLVAGDHAQGRYVLRLEGFVDLDGDGVFTAGADTAFAYTPHAIPLPTWCAVAPVAPEVLRPGGSVVRSLVLDVKLLLLGVDILDHPVADGADSVALQLERNLSIAFR
jgi:hypothetical protein